MSNLKNLLLRIKTVKSTQKITKVMKMIAASKLRAAQRDVLSSTNFEKSILNSVCKIGIKDFFCNTLSSENELIVLITSNRGLCGGYNINVVKNFTQYVHNKKNYKIFFIGTKAYDMLHKQYANHVAGYVKNEKISFFQVKQMFDNFLQEKFSTISVFYTHFENSFLLIPKFDIIFPFISAQDYIQNSTIANYTSSEHAQFNTEPERSILLNSILLDYAYARLFRMLKSSIACEHMSRMIAMDNASNNASEVMDSLRMHYNKSRQSKVTNELIEIISGMEAL